MSVARLARDVLPQPWLLHRLIKHVAPRVRAEADRELQPLARTIIERHKLKRGEQPRCVLSTALRIPSAEWFAYNARACEEEGVLVVPEHSIHGCLTLRAGLALPTCSWHYLAWLRIVGVEWAARELGLVPFSGMLHWSVDQRGHQMDPLVELRWPFAPHRPPGVGSMADGERVAMTFEQAHVLADAIADAGRMASADLVRRLADGAEHHATRARGSLRA